MDRLGERAPRGLTAARPLRPAPLAALAIVCAVALAAIYVVFVRTQAGQRIDEAARSGRLASPHARHAADELLTTISAGGLVLVLVLLAGQALVRRRVGLAIVAVAVVIGAVMTTEVLKHVLLERPRLVSSPIDRNSFPSGHTTTAFAVGIAAVLVAPPRWRRAVAVGALLYGSAIGIATIAAGWHRPSDVAGAVLVVVGWAAAVVLAVALVDRDAFDGARAGAATWARTPDLEAYGLLAAVALVVGWVVAVAIVAGTRVGAIELTTLNAAFVAACACVAALAALSLAALLGVLRASLPAE